MPRKGRKPKYKVGDMVYSWQNPTVKRRICFITDQGYGYSPQYRVTLVDKEGYTRTSKYMDESSIRKTKRRKK